MDYKIFEAINGLAGNNRSADAIGVFLGVYLIYVSAVFALFLFNDKRYWMNVWIAIISAVISRLAIVESIKHIINRPRPYEIINAHLLVTDTEKGLSFSSGHTVILFSIAFAFHKTKYFYPFLIAAILGSTARVFIGVHYPSDVVASIIIALITVTLVKMVVKTRVFSKLRF